jgi:putative endonuclease
MHSYWTYILASRPRGTLYVGVTNGLPTRVEQHRIGIGSAFTRKYCVHMLVWYEEFAEIEAAIQRAKTLKHPDRACKPHLIERTPPPWTDLSPSLLGVAPVPTLVPSREMGPRDKREDDT